VEERLGRREVEATAVYVLVGERDLDGEATFRASDVDEGFSRSQGNLAAIALCAPILSPVIAWRNCPRRAGSAYSASKKLPPAFASFCGCPLRSASVSDAQNGYSRAFAISSKPPM
jgi:hypothetical protein